MTCLETKIYFLFSVQALWLWNPLRITFISVRRHSLTWNRFMQCYFMKLLQKFHSIDLNFKSLRIFLTVDIVSNLSLFLSKCVKWKITVFLIHWSSLYVLVISNILSNKIQGTIKYETLIKSQLYKSTYEGELSFSIIFHYLHGSAEDLN
jgi:hypothetical protein